MTKKEALLELAVTGELTTAMLKPLGISLEAFLRYTQVHEGVQRQAVRYLLADYDHATFRDACLCADSGEDF